MLVLKRGHLEIRANNDNTMSLFDGHSLFVKPLNNYIFLKMYESSLVSEVIFLFFREELPIK